MVDIAEIKVIAGDGGDGIVAFRREKNIAKGGPNGGDGGKGGSVFLLADHNLATLIDFHTKPVFRAQKGASGGKNNKTGISGEDVYIRVPLGTLVYVQENATDTLIGDLIEPGQVLLVAQGGVGGKGNSRFKSSTNRTPRQFTRGTPGEFKKLRLEIKVLADVGLIGMPNAGKSTLINQLTPARAKIGSYPFTTLTPNLGICMLPGDKSVAIADIPGLIQGASTGKGLGGDFLRHVERTRLLVHIIDPLTANLEDSLVATSLARYKLIRQELLAYGGDLISKKELIAINKVDITEVAGAVPSIIKAFEKEHLKALPISAATGQGITTLKNEIAFWLEKIPATPKFEVVTPVKFYTINNLPNTRHLFKEPAVLEG